MNRRASKALGGVRAAQLPDNVQLLRALAEARPTPLLIPTPPQDYVRARHSRSLALSPLLVYIYMCVCMKSTVWVPLVYT